MAYYLERAEDLKELVDTFVEEFLDGFDVNKKNDALIQLGYIINLAIRCNPRQPQGTVRRNIIQKAIGDHVVVSMTKEVSERGSTYNKLHLDV